MDIRKTYNVNVEANRLNLSYDLDGQTRSYSIPFENMPIGGFAQTICFGQRTSKVTGIFVIDAIRGAENITGQQLSQTEAEGFAKHGVKRIEYGVAGNMIALAGAYGIAWTGRKDMKFPFIKPKEPERYTNFPNRYAPILQGSWARLAWQFTRANIYAFIGLLAAGPLFGSMGDVSMMVGLYQDGRTQSVLKKMKEKGGFDRINSNRPRPGQPKAQPQAQPQGDDMSPQDGYQDSSYGGVDAYSGDGAFTDGSTDSGLMSDSIAAQRQIQQSQQTSPQRRPPVRQQSQSQPEKSSSSDFFFDDASPTAGNDPDMAAPTPYNRRSGESAWARIRRTNPNTEQQNYTGRHTAEQNLRRNIGELSQSTSELEQKVKQPGGFGVVGGGGGGETKGDSFSFSRSDEERQLAKQQAQREFDAMLEKERKDSGSADYGRGMQAAQGGSEESGIGGGGSAWERRRGSGGKL